MTTKKPKMLVMTAARFIRVAIAMVVGGAGFGITLVNLFSDLPRDVSRALTISALTLYIVFIVLLVIDFVASRRVSALSRGFTSYEE